jgi:diguanylate cyclase (GGDEF)-like protein
MVCKNLDGMTVPVGYWVALLSVLCGLVYLGLRYRALRATAGDLSTALSRRETELLEARESLHRIAAIDPVTSLANHSAFQEFLQAEWRRALREASCISVLLVDIDYFRDYNDRLGHQAGDECLARIGSTLKGVVQRPGDLVARYGGGEFAVVMSRTDPQGASLVAHRICAAVEAVAMKHPESEVSPHVTVSVGVSTSTPAVDSHWEELELVAAANRALTQAKEAGRNQIATIEADPEDPTSET